MTRPAEITYPARATTATAGTLWTGTPSQPVSISAAIRRIQCRLLTRSRSIGRPVLTVDRNKASRRWQELGRAQMETSGECNVDKWMSTFEKRHLPASHRVRLLYYPQRSPMDIRWLLFPARLEWLEEEFPFHQRPDPLCAARFVHGSIFQPTKWAGLRFMHFYILFFSFISPRSPIIL